MFIASSRAWGPSAGTRTPQTILASPTNHFFHYKLLTRNNCNKLVSITETEYPRILQRFNQIRGSFSNLPKSIEIFRNPILSALTMADKSKETKKDETKDAAGDTDRTETKRSRVADLLFLDDDDDFEEFPQEDWGKAEENKDDEKATAWSENWDDDELEDEFSKKLQAELEKMKTTPKAPTAAVPMSH